MDEVWLKVVLLVVLGLVVPVVAAERLEGRVRDWLLRAGRNRAPRTALAVVGLHAGLGAVLAVAAVAAYALPSEDVGGGLVLAVAVPLLSVSTVFSPSSWNAPDVRRETAALRERGASRATAYTVFWLGFACLLGLLGAAAGLVFDLWLF